MWLDMRFARLCLTIVACCWSSVAAAAVEIHFYSKDFASTFPHAFVRLTGTVDATGEQLDTNYGLTQVRLNRSILMGTFNGMIESVVALYVAGFYKHFRFML